MKRFIAVLFVLFSVTIFAQTDSTTTKSNFTQIKPIVIKQIGSVETNAVYLQIQDAKLDNSGEVTVQLLLDDANHAQVWSGSFVFAEFDVTDETLLLQKVLTKLGAEKAN